MARPTIDPALLQSGLEGWDALLRDLINALTAAPFPVKEYANLAAFPAANLYDRCLAATVDTNELYISNGTTWKKITREA